MKTLLEISIAGDIFFFRNNLTNREYEKLHNFTLSYIEKSRTNNHVFSVDDYVHAVYNNLSIDLTQYIIDKVISI